MPISARMTSAERWPTPGMVHNSSTSAAKGGGGRLDARRQGGDVGFELLHVGEHPLQEEGVMRREPGGEGLAQRRATGAKDRQDLASRQLVRLRVATAAASR